MDVTYCSLTVNLTNNTEDGAVTFSKLSCLDETGDDFSPQGQPFTVKDNVDPGETQQLLYAEGFGVYNALLAEWAELDKSEGTAIFNMPNGDTLTIDWKISVTGSQYPTIKPSSNYYHYAGLTDPTVSSHSNYVFNVVVS